jgi:hypothetical protein
MVQLQVQRTIAASPGTGVPLKLPGDPRRVCDGVGRTFALNDVRFNFRSNQLCCTSFGSEDSAVLKRRG